MKQPRPPKVSKAPAPYNPLEKRRLAESIVRELLSSPVEKLPPEEPFLGAGIYVIYYRGKLPMYARLAEQNKEAPTVPIYVGKAISPGRRKGGFSDVDPTPVLFTRLGQHASSIRQATNLKIEDFACQYLVVDEFWIGLAESLLIDSFKPVWNVVVDGFGNHDPGAGRHGGKRPNWDVIHAGRPWAARLQPAALSELEILAKVTSHLDGR